MNALRVRPGILGLKHTILETFIPVSYNMADEALPNDVIPNNDDWAIVYPANTRKFKYVHFNDPLIISPGSLPLFIATATTDPAWNIAAILSGGDTISFEVKFTLSETDWNPATLTWNNKPASVGPSQEIDILMDADNSGDTGSIRAGGAGITFDLPQEDMEKTYYGIIVEISGLTLGKYYPNGTGSNWTKYQLQ